MRSVGSAKHAHQALNATDLTVMNHTLRLSSLVAATLALCGCSNLSGLGGSNEFRCHAPEGVPCMSVSGVAANDAAGTLAGARAAGSTEDARGAGRATSTHSPAAEGSVPRLTPVMQASASSAVERVGQLGAIRSEPTVIRIWVAPWQDADGDLNDQGYVYLQIDAGRWLIEHNRERIRREFSPRAAQVANGGAGAALKPAPLLASQPPSQVQALKPPRPYTATAGNTEAQPQ
jgi:conjugal transfer pilus assembly protein TraV